MKNREYLRDAYSSFQSTSLIYKICMIKDLSCGRIVKEKEMNGIIEFLTNKKVRISIENQYTFKISEKYYKEDFVVFKMHDFFKTVTVYLIIDLNEDANNSSIMYAMNPREGSRDIMIEKAFYCGNSKILVTY